jgi:hypothetical protein
VLLHSGYTSLCTELGPFDWTGRCERSLYTEFVAAVCDAAGLQIPPSKIEICLLRANASELAGVEQRMVGRMYWGVGYGLPKDGKKGVQPKMQMLMGMDHRDWNGYCE